MGEKFNLHPNAVDDINKTAQSLLKLIKEMPPPAKAHRESHFPIESETTHTINAADIIGDIALGTANYFGEETSRYFQVGKKFYGLSDACFADLIRLAEKVHKKKDINRAVSLGFILDLLFVWLRESFCGFRSSGCCEFVLDSISIAVDRQEIWVPIANLHIQGELTVGPTQLKPLSRDLINGWEKVAVDSNPNQEAAIRELFQKFRKKYQGLAAAVTVIIAEEKRACEIAIADAERAIAVLRFFSPANFMPHVNSNSLIFGHSAIRTTVTLNIKDETISSSHESIAEVGPPYWRLDQQTIGDIRHSLLPQLGELLQRTDPSEFQDKLLECVLVYAKVSSAKEIIEKMLYLLASIEGMLLKDGGEPIQQNLGERMATIIGKDLAHKKGIILNIKRTYEMRSNFVHHAQSIDDLQTLKETMFNVWETFCYLISHNKDFVTKKEFLESVDDKKLS